MMPERMLGDYGLNCSTAKAQAPAQVGLAYKNNGMNDWSWSYIFTIHICTVYQICLGIFNSNAEFWCYLWKWNV